MSDDNDSTGRPSQCLFDTAPRSGREVAACIGAASSNERASRDRPLTKPTLATARGADFSGIFVRSRTDRRIEMEQDMFREVT